MKHPIFKKSKTSPMRRLYLRNRSRLNFSQRSIVDHIKSLFGELYLKLKNKSKKTDSYVTKRIVFENDLTRIYFRDYCLSILPLSTDYFRDFQKNLDTPSNISNGLIDNLMIAVEGGTGHEG